MSALGHGQPHAMPSAATAGSDRNTVCSNSGVWLDPSSGDQLAHNVLYDQLSTKPAVLLGETHDNAEHHRWQLHLLAGLHSRTKRLVIGFEMFPRRLQGVLDRWAAGELSEDAFLKDVDWRQTWGYDASFYMPLFQFTRMHRIPMVALNVDRQLVSRVGSEGWDAVPENEREGLSNPAAPSAEYLRRLARVYSEKLRMVASGQMSGTGSLPKESDEVRIDELEEILKRPAFKRFAEAQLTWDRAMAEALVEARKNHPRALVVGLMGSGHLEYFHGVPHQLEDLGVAESSVLLPVSAGATCIESGEGIADAIFTVQDRSVPQSTKVRPVLGVRLDSASKAAIVDQVVPDSVAESANLRKGDRIVRAAGVDVDGPETLIDIVARQAPGTWLPLTIDRSRSVVELVARFPAAQRQTPQ